MGDKTLENKISECTLYKPIVLTWNKFTIKLKKKKLPIHFFPEVSPKGAGVDIHHYMNGNARGIFPCDLESWES